MTYEEQLCDHRWIEKRERIVERDLGMCQRCMSSRKLHVHHKYYIIGRAAWDYDDSALITLCDSCHKSEHEFKKIKVLEREDRMVELVRFIKETAYAIRRLDEKMNA